MVILAILAVLVPFRYLCENLGVGPAASDAGLSRGKGEAGRDGRPPGRLRYPRCRRMSKVDQRDALEVLTRALRQVVLTAEAGEA